MRSMERPARLLRIAAAAFLVLTLLKVWVQPRGLLPEARAQIPDAAAQRNELMEQAKRTNQLLTDILEVLRAQPFKVESVGTDKTGATPRPAPSRPK
jgi:hypothetical protein